MNKEKIAIVVPIYNAEKYLKECVESLLEQTYTNLQIILVNDGSQDNSIKICNELKEKDNRILVINGKNEGVSKARNKGIDVTDAKYIMFVDADDYILPSYVEDMYNFMNQNNIDAVKTGWTRFNDNEKKQLSFIEEDYQIFNSNQIVEFILKNNRYFNSACTILYSLEIIKKNKIHFETNLKHGEDTLFFIDYLNVCKRIGYIKNTGYCYRFNSSSTSNKVDIDARIKYCIDTIIVYYTLYNKYGLNEQIAGLVLERINYSLKIILYNQPMKYTSFKNMVKKFDSKQKYLSIKKHFSFHLKYNVKFLEKIEMLFIAKKKYGIYYFIIKIKSLFKK